VVDLLCSDVASERDRSMSLVVQAYRAPVQKHLRARWRLSDDEAAELAQEFFATAFAKGYLEAYDPTKARFRTFVRMCADRMVSTRRRDAQRQKRGGGVATVALETAGAELSDDGASPEELFDREWVRSVFSMSVSSLREACERRGRPAYFTVFSRYDLEDPDEPVSYASLAKELGVTPKDVANYLTAARREFRRILLDTLRQLTASEEEFRDEARLLLGTDP
jgi:RNA polymerase sigma-70 factor (ECF subfamily)